MTEMLDRIAKIIDPAAWQPSARPDAEFSFQREAARQKARDALEETARWLEDAADIPLRNGFTEYGEGLLRARGHRFGQIIRGQVLTPQDFYAQA